MQVDLEGKKYVCESPNPRILYVDDDQDGCEMIGLMLKLANQSYEITAVSDARKALVLMEKQPVSLLILDSGLPEISGIELCRRIRLTDSQTPIMFYSGMAREIDRREAMAAGATEYLVKPNDLEKLTETVERLLTAAATVSTDKASHTNRLF